MGFHSEAEVSEGAARQSLSMFKSLRTSTKLLLLCIVFVGALVVTTFGLVAEKQIAIDFVRKELVGVRHLEALRGSLRHDSDGKPGRAAERERRSAAKEALDRLPETGSVDSESLDTAAARTRAREATDKLASAADDDQRRTVFVDALTAARNLASRIGDDSNLTLDPDLDSYYVQDMVVAKMPTLLSQIGELQSQLEMPSSAQSTPENLAVRALVLDGIIRSTIEGIERDLQASYRGGSGARLRQVLDADVAAMISAGTPILTKRRRSSVASARQAPSITPMRLRWTARSTLGR